MQINPEIQRNIWLDFSLHRILAMPVIIGVILLITYFGSLSHEGILNEYGIQDMIRVSLILFFAIIFYWGCYRATGTIAEEINDNTWDYQRLSSISPLSLSIGKIIGSTFYNWYGGLICLVAFSALALPYHPADLVLRSVIILIVSGLLAQTIAVLVGMQSLRSPHKTSRRKMLGYRILGLVIGHCVAFGISYYPWLQNNLWHKSPKDIAPNALMMYFYNYNLAVDDFVFYSLWIFLFWAFIGVYRTMRLELQIRTLPWIWPLFLLFVTLYSAGISGTTKLWINLDSTLTLERPEASYISRILITGFLLGLLTSYLMFFSDRISIIRYRMMSHYFKNKAFAKAAEFLPKLAISYLISIIFFILSITYGLAYDQKDFLSSVLLSLSCLLFVLRDIGILHFFMMAPDNRRAILATLIYLVVLYGLFAALARVLKIDAEGFLYPSLTRTEPIHLLFIFGQVLFVAFLVSMRWKKADAAISANEAVPSSKLSGQAA